MRSLLLALLLLTCLAPATRAAEQGRTPNVLFICVDDLKPMLGCYGQADVKTPNIDRLAARSVRFDAAYCNQAVCAPSRNALLTGLRPTTIGIYDLPTFFREGSRPDATTMPQLFMQRGWRTTSLGKIFHVGHGNHTDPASWSTPAWRPKAPMYAQRAGGSAADKGPAVESADVPDETYADGLIAMEAVGRLQQAKQKPAEPFFLMVGFQRPHLPFVAPKRYWDLYDPKSFLPDDLQSAPAGAPPYAPTKWGELRNYADIPDTGDLDADLQRKLIHGYHAATSYMDAQVGKVLDELDRLDLAQSTIVVFWGDHGYHLGDHGMWCKHTNYEQATRIPLMVRVPGTSKDGGAFKGLIESVDVYPTMCDVLGVPAPQGLDGKSFAAALKDPDGAPKEAAAFQVFPRSAKETGKGQLLGRAVRTERYRLVEWKKPGAPAESADIELYDFQTDPRETKNVAADQPDVVAKLRAILAGQGEAVAPIKAKAKKAPSENE
jgi:iduronate 2-sulfatase